MASPERTWETARLVAKPAAVADAQIMFDDYASDPAVAKYMTWTPHRNVAETKEFLSRCERVWIEGSAFPWRLGFKQEGAFWGRMEARGRESAVDLVYALARGGGNKGFRREAVPAVSEWPWAKRRISGVWPPCMVKTEPRRGSSNER